MSHLHSIQGQIDASQQYTAMLERAQAAALAKELADVRKRLGTRQREPLADPDGDSGQQRRDREEPGQESEDQEPETGFGTHYA